ncbi:28S ribosomal protein S14, mitochondrial [Cephus cinctus]|uniref:28S ribosomal protein S14, mitochondrial n=1 Tax=Cephus cinctus TaxID=211228 RepID=A0AAJ7FKM2_CEPCN|nr:28S ribosomal protein S14, mitochondrial [Cephus cinctus]
MQLTGLNFCDSRFSINILKQTASTQRKMAALGQGVSSLTKFIWRSPDLAGYGFQQVRNKWADWKMIRDVKRRKCVQEHCTDRVRVLALKRNNVLPPEIREIASKEMDENFPRNSAPCRITFRCALTSRPRGVVYRWRLSRIVFRDLADHNLLSGVQRAMW